MLQANDSSTKLRELPWELRRRGLKDSLRHDQRVKEAIRKNLRELTAEMHGHRSQTDVGPRLFGQKRVHNPLVGLQAKGQHVVAHHPDALVIAGACANACG